MSRTETRRATAADRPAAPDTEGSPGRPVHRSARGGEAAGSRPGRAHPRGGTAMSAAATTPTGTAPGAGDVGGGTVMGTVTTPTPTATATAIPAARAAGPGGVAEPERGGAACPRAAVGP
ncbi:hypothetical protein [Streptomyces griseosporeus]|uniref:hypothetical protein n=1 Tax=Streptomyces griseosporeus TaxID=1910 RepID=UPI0036FB4B37